MADANRALPAPSGLEFERRIVVGLLDAETIVKIDWLAVARRTLSVARVVGAHHAHTRIVEIEARHALRHVPRRISETHAFALRAAGAGDLECPLLRRSDRRVGLRTAGQRERLPAAVRAGVADVLP